MVQVQLARLAQQVQLVRQEALAQPDLQEALAQLVPTQQWLVRQDLPAPLDQPAPPAPLAQTRQ